MGESETDCIFCKIVAGEIPSEFLYEDDDCVVFNDANPKTKTHLLILPKKHIPTIADLEEGDEKIMGHLIMVAKNLAAEMNLAGYQLQINVGRDGGQEVFHVHIHLMSKF